MKKLKISLFTLAGASIVPIIAFAGGYNFDARNVYVALGTAMAMMLAILGFIIGRNPDDL